jgi:hypothetical protein
VIPTGYKTKIPRTHSYPLAAKAISDALIGVPQRELLKIDFWFFKGFAKDRAPGAPYRVLGVSYSGPDPGPFTEWSIQVHAIPRSLKHIIRGKLTSEALPKMRDWLVSNAHTLDREGSHRLTFYFDESKDEITSEEASTTEWSTERA